MQGLRGRFLHTLTYHHASNKFDTVPQGTKITQEVLNDLKKYAAWMIQPPNIYTFCKQFVSTLCDFLCNEVLKKGYNAKFSTINQLYETAHMIEEASCYNHRMRHAKQSTYSSEQCKAHCIQTSTLHKPVRDLHRERECSASHADNACVHCTKT